MPDLDERRRGRRDRPRATPRANDDAAPGVVGDERDEPIAEDARGSRPPADRRRGAPAHGQVVRADSHARAIVDGDVTYNSGVRLRVLKVGCFGGGTGLPSRARRTQAHSVGRSARHRHDVRQRRVVGTAARRARRAAAGRRAQVRADARAQRARGAQDPADAAADARARQARRPHRRQSAAVDDGAVHRRLHRRPSTRCARCSAAAATCGRSPSSGRRSCAEYADGSRTRGEVEVDAGQAGGRSIGRLWLDPPVSIHPAVADDDSIARRRRHRAGQLLHEPAADLPRRRLPRGARARCAARSSTSRIC